MGEPIPLCGVFWEGEKGHHKDTAKFPSQLMNLELYKIQSWWLGTSCVQSSLFRSSPWLSYYLPGILFLHPSSCPHNSCCSLFWWQPRSHQPSCFQPFATALHPCVMLETLPFSTGCITLAPHLSNSRPQAVVCGLCTIEMFLEGLQARKAEIRVSLSRCWWRTFFLVTGSDFLECLPVVEGARELPGVLFHKCTSLDHEGATLMTKALPKAPLFIPSLWELACLYLPLWRDTGFRP